MNAFNKKTIAIEYSLRGMMMADAKFTPVLKAFELAKSYHNGMRKDGETPEFSHQLNIVGYFINCQKMLLDPVGTLVAALMHDVVEDYSKGSKFWENESGCLKGLTPYGLDEVERDFGKKSKTTIDRLSKVINGYKKPTDQYFGELYTDMNALLVKAVDRLDNLNSMYSVFTLAKQRQYAMEVFDNFIPALKKGEALFPEQSFAYQMLKMSLKDKARSVLKNLETLEESGFDFSLTIGEQKFEKFKGARHRGERASQEL